MRSLRMVGRAWAAFAGAAAFAYGYMSLAPMLSRDLYDVIAAWGTVALGAATGLLLARSVSAAMRLRKAGRPAQASTSAQRSGEVLVRS